MDVVVVLVVLFLVVLVISAPLRRARRTDAASTGELAELEAAREAKYREIRDAELDHRTGKLSDADYEALDSVLRAEAVVILRQLDDVRERDTSTSAPASLR
jgi:type II secretory pathway component PulM